MSTNKEKNKENPARPNEAGDTNTGPMGVPGPADGRDDVITGGSDLGPEIPDDDSSTRGGEVY